MNSRNCNDCNRNDCFFKTDPFDEHCEVCVKCGRSYSSRGNDSSWLFMIIWIIIGLLLLGNEPDPKPQFQQETQSNITKPISKI